MIGNWFPQALKESLRAQRLRYRYLRQYDAPMSSIAALTALMRLALAPRRTILFLPEMPNEWQVVYKTCLINRYRMVNDPKLSHDVIHKHQRATISDPVAYVPLTYGVINSAADDISKSNVQDGFAEVFGYSLKVDPMSYNGRAVRKSNDNYRHDGVIVDCPHDPEDEVGVVYQRLIETENEDGLCVDMRVPVYGGDVPLVYVKYRPSTDRFKTYLSGKVVEPTDVLSDQEVALIVALARRLGIDFGEMDVLRSNDDGRIYVVDVNNTPAGPPVKLTEADQRHAIAILSKAYNNVVEGFINDSHT